MAKLVARIGIWAVILAIVLVGGWWCLQELDGRRHPTESKAMRLVEKRLGDMTPEQRKTARALVAQYPIETMLAAHRSGWRGLEQLRTHGPDVEQQIQVLALKADPKHLDHEAAVQFTNTSLSMLYAFEQVDAAYAASLLDAMRGLSPEEYRNVAFDPSYVQIAPQLDPKYRTQFRENQDILTPLLAATEPAAWNDIMEDFQAAQPRAGEIFRDPEMGPPFAIVYILNREIVPDLVDKDVGEPEAIAFLGINAQTVRAARQEDLNWLAPIKAMQVHSGPTAEDGTPMSLFDWACNDPAVYWIVHHDVSPNKRHALDVLGRYAGTDVPSVLMLHYGENTELLNAAIEALARFDNNDDPDPAKRQAAALMLCHYQNDPVFKDALQKLGSILVPALGAGGEEALAAIQENPANIHKHVNEDGTARGTPWWTWIPGGSIALVIREMSEGRTVTMGEWTWAAVDGAVFIPGASLVGKLARPAFSTTRGGLKAVGKTAGSALKREARALTSRGVQRGTHRLLPRAMMTVHAAGRPVAKVVRQVGGKVAAFADKHPVVALATGIVIFAHINPDGASRLVSNITARIGSMGTAAMKSTARALAGLPGQLLDALRDELRELRDKQPMLAPLYVLWYGVVIVVMFAIPIWVLRMVLRPAYDTMVGGVRYLTRWVRPTPRRRNRDSGGRR